jgi:hypothetical protein
MEIGLNFDTEPTLVTEDTSTILIFKLMINNASLVMVAKQSFYKYKLSLCNDTQFAQNLVGPQVFKKTHCWYYSSNSFSFETLLLWFEEPSQKSYAIQQLSRNLQDNPQSI